MLSVFKLVSCKPGASRELAFHGNVRFLGVLGFLRKRCENHFSQHS